MAKTIEIPIYLLVNVLRHYKALANAKIDSRDIKVSNARRLAHPEIAKVERLIRPKSHDRSHPL